MLRMSQHGADIIGFVDEENQRNTLLHVAVKDENRELIGFLKTLNVDFDAENSNGETALHLCCGQTPNEELAKFLVMAGASTGVKNALGDTAIALAKRCGNTELALMLNTSDAAAY